MRLKSCNIALNLYNQPHEPQRQIQQGNIKAGVEVAIQK